MAHTTSVFALAFSVLSLGISSARADQKDVGVCKPDMPSYSASLQRFISASTGIDAEIVARPQEKSLIVQATHLIESHNLSSYSPFSDSRLKGVTQFRGVDLNFNYKKHAVKAKCEMGYVYWQEDPTTCSHRVGFRCGNFTSDGKKASSEWVNGIGAEFQRVLDDSLGNFVDMPDPIYQAKQGSLSVNSYTWNTTAPVVSNRPNSKKEKVLPSDMKTGGSKTDAPPRNSSPISD